MNRLARAFTRLRTGHSSEPEVQVVQRFRNLHLRLAMTLAHSLWLAREAPLPAAELVCQP